MATILIPLATGFEEIEAVTLIDVLRRAGINVLVVSLHKNLEVQGANGIIVKADQFMEDINSDNIDMILLPGGWGGTDILAQNDSIQHLIKDMDSKNKTIGAICAAPFALDNAGVLKNKFTCYPSVEEQISNKNYTKESKVIEDNNIITSQGPGTAMCLALYLVKKFSGNEMYEQLKIGLLADFCN